MKMRLGAATLVLGLLVALPGYSQKKSPVALPDDARIAPIKYGDMDTAVTLNPAEQVAFLMVSSIWRLEERCYDKDSGVGRTVALGELVKGTKLKDGETAALSVNPARDSNYTYDVILVGDFCLVKAIPRNPAWGGAFALIGTPKGFGNTCYYNPKGQDLARALKVTEMGYGGNGFIR
jgi:hypothetical protein